MEDKTQEIINLLCKSGWGDTKGFNLVFKIKEIIENYCKMEAKLKTILKIATAN